MNAIVLAAAALSLVMPVTGQSSSTFSPDAEGFIRNWLVLAPIPMFGESGAEEIHYDLLDGEARILPKPDAEVTVGDEVLTWTPHQTSAYYIDFRQSFGSARGEHVNGYAVAYVHADVPMDVTLALGTNDQARAWLNGREVLVFEEARILTRDADRIPVSLVQGQNVLVLKVINEVNNWQAAARFLNGETPITNLKIALTPQ